jgi:hypothetical protein
VKNPLKIGIFQIPEEFLDILMTIYARLFLKSIKKDGSTGKVPSDP